MTCDGLAADSAVDEPCDFSFGKLKLTGKARAGAGVSLRENQQHVCAASSYLSETNLQKL